MSTNFADLGVSKAVADALGKRGIESPFPVQRLVIEDVLDGRDVLVQSPTGSGKTLAFGVPLVDLIAADSRRPAALVLAPTRELARQIVEELGSIARARALKVEVVYGGVGMEPQIRKAPKAHILVATPGRLEDLLQRRALTLANVRTLVLDEADRMLDMGFKPAVDRIVKQIPADRQTLFFSATLEGAAGEVAAAYTRDARRHVHAPKPEGGRAAISHRFHEAPSQAAKVDLLVGELGDRDRGRTLVFVRTKRGADRLVKKLRARDVEAVAMHGDKSQSQRQKALARFERGEVTVLIATDVAARGIDVPDVTGVINFDAPEEGDTYTHRVGRTGRAGARGAAATFVLADQVHDVRQMARRLGLAAEFERRDGADAESAPRRDQGRGNGRQGSGRGQGSHRSADGSRKSKQGGGGSTGSSGRRRRRRRPRQAARG
ncbi:MAG: DEAD/DEAH box helicase [Solirubrobacterales bacterium]